MLTKHDNTVRRQHDAIPELSLTKTACAKPCPGTEEKSTEYSVSRAPEGKWLFYSKGKLVKPYDYTSSNYSTLLSSGFPEGKRESASDPGERASKRPYSSEREAFQYTFAHACVQTSSKTILLREDATGATHHGWQPALMTGLMWMANVAGEFLDHMNEDLQVSPLRVIPVSQKHFK